MSMPRIGYLPLSNTLKLAHQYGEWLIGVQEFRDKNKHIDGLWKGFARAGERFNKSQPYDHKNYTDQEAMWDFVNFISPFLSQARLHQITGWLLEKEIDCNRSQLLRNSTLAKVFLLHEARQLKFLEGKIKSHFSSGNHATFEAIHFFENMVIPLPLLQLYKIHFLPILNADDKTIGEHFYFNVIKPLLGIKISEMNLSLDQELGIEKKLLAIANNQQPSAEYNAFRMSLAQQIKNVDEKRETMFEDSVDLDAQVNAFTTELQRYGLKKRKAQKGAASQGDRFRLFKKTPASVVSVVNLADKSMILEELAADRTLGVCEYAIDQLNNLKKTYPNNPIVDNCDNLEAQATTILIALKQSNVLSSAQEMCARIDYLTRAAEHAMNETTQKKSTVDTGLYHDVVSALSFVCDKAFLAEVAIQQVCLSEVKSKNNFK